MLIRLPSRQISSLPNILACLVLLSVSPAAHASMLDEASCQKLRTEQQALTVLGIDKHVEKGADWAEKRLTVADLNLVKRYFDVFEQLKFRCEKIVAAVEVPEPDEVEGATGAVPPMPQRKVSTRPVKSTTNPPAAVKPKSGSAIERQGAPLSASAIPWGPAEIVPVR